MDFCTMAVITTQTLALCAPLESACWTSEDGARQYCQQFPATFCKPAESTYLCVRPDGSTYEVKQSKAK